MAAPPSSFNGSPRTLPSGTDEAGRPPTSKFYERRDNRSSTCYTCLDCGENFDCCLLVARVEARLSFLIEASRASATVMVTSCHGSLIG